MLQPVFNDDRSNKKVREVTVYKRFADLTERCFLDTFMLLFYESMKSFIVYQDFLSNSVYIISVHQYKLLCLLQLIFYTLRALSTIFNGTLFTKLVRNILSKKDL